MIVILLLISILDVTYDYTDLDQSQVQHKGLSLVDRACIALGIKLQVPIYTADRVWAQLQLSNSNINSLKSFSQLIHCLNIFMA